MAAFLPTAGSPPLPLARTNDLQLPPPDNGGTEQSAWRRNAKQIDRNEEFYKCHSLAIHIVCQLQTSTPTFAAPPATFPSRSSHPSPCRSSARRNACCGDERPKTSRCSPCRRGSASGCSDARRNGTVTGVTTCL